MADVQNPGVTVETRDLNFTKCSKSECDERMFVFASDNKVYKTVFSLNLPRPVIKKLQYILEVELEDFIDRYFINDKNLLTKVHTPSFHIEIKTCPWWVPEEFKILSLNGKPLKFIKSEYIFCVTLCPKIKSLLGMSEKFEDDHLHQDVQARRLGLESDWSNQESSSFDSSSESQSQDRNECDEMSDWSQMSTTDQYSNSSSMQMDDLPGQSVNDDLSTEPLEDRSDPTSSSPRVFLVTKVEENNAVPSFGTDEGSSNTRPADETPSQLLYAGLSSTNPKVEVDKINFMSNAEKLLSGTAAASSSSTEDVQRKLTIRGSEIFGRNSSKVVEFNHQDPYSSSEINVDDDKKTVSTVIVPLSDEIYQQERKKSFGWGFITKLFGK